MQTAPVPHQIKSLPNSRMLLVYLLIGLTLFPYVKLIPTDSDTQPNAFLIAGLLLFVYLRPGRVSRPVLWLWLLPPIGVAVFAFELQTSTDLVNNLRSLYNYLALPVIATTFALLNVPVRRQLFRTLNVVTVIYFLVGLTQLLTAQQLVGSIVGGGFRVDTYDMVHRGAVSLAPEPTAYATIMFLFLVLYSMIGRERSWGAALSFFQILFFAKSTAVIFFIIIVVIMRAIAARRFKALAIAACAVGLMWFLVFNMAFFSTSRVRSVTSMLMTDPARLLETDYSVSSRLGSAWYGCLGALRTYGVPNGFNSFVDYYNVNLLEIDWLSTRAKVNIMIPPGSRIMSGYGGALFELGLFGLIVPLSFVFLVRREFGGLLTPKAVTCFVGTNLVAFAAGVPVGFPPLAMMWGLLGGKLSREATSQELARRDGSSVPLDQSQRLPAFVAMTNDN